MEYLHKGRDGADNENTGRDFEGDGEEDQVVEAAEILGNRTGHAAMAGAL